MLRMDPAKAGLVEHHKALLILAGLIKDMAKNCQRRKTHSTAKLTPL